LITQVIQVAVARRENDLPVTGDQCREKFNEDILVVQVRQFLGGVDDKGSAAFLFMGINKVR
jgi:hypothetical protein